VIAMGPSFARPVWIGKRGAPRRGTLVPMSMPLVGGLFATVAGLVVLILLVRRGMSAARAALDELAAGRTPLRSVRAQSYGIRSRGRTQLRGLGYLALFDDELVFQQVLAKNHVRVPRGDLVAVTTPRSFLGKSGGRRLLALEWKTDAGTDMAAFLVRDLDAWLTTLERAGVPIERETAK